MSKIQTLMMLLTLTFAGIHGNHFSSYSTKNINTKSVGTTELSKKEATVNNTNLTLFCIGKKNGLFIGGCTWFYRCKDGETEHVPCPVDLVVNELYMYCDYPEKVDPPCGKALNCTDVWDGNYPDYTRRCKFYYTCLRGRFHGYSKCPAALYFDPDKDSCDWPNLIPPPCGTKGTK